MKNRVRGVSVFIPKVWDFFVVVFVLVGFFVPVAGVGERCERNRRVVIGVYWSMENFQDYFYEQFLCDQVHCVFRNEVKSRNTYKI